MNLTTLDWLIVAAFFVVSLGIGLAAARRAGKSEGEFFLSGRNMPWWLLGISMVATTFSADTPNLVTDIVRQNGVSGNWAWWAFLLTGMLTVFVYARLWRRSGVLTDLEFYELRYSGAEAAFLRGFRAVYLGIVFNVVVMATVCLAGIKIGGILLGLDKYTILLVAGTITVIYSAIGGLRGIIWTDFFQFGLAMIGTFWAMFYILDLPQIGGLDALLAHPNVSGKLNLLPNLNDWNTFVPLLLVPIAVQWWASYYPGAEPGGGGYIAQRMLAAKNEDHALSATLLFNVAHYALRPWPWILIALASLVVFPDLADIQRLFPNIDDSIVGHDLAYPAMLSFLPTGLLGLVVASLIAAFMSTISTHLNWGSSYLSHDVYARFLKPEASEKELVNVGRISTVVLMLLTALLSLLFESALEVFNVILLIGAGTGSIFILRWFWWRVNAYSELAGMVISFIVAFGLTLIDTGLESWQELLVGVAITTVGWIVATLLTRPTDPATLRAFYRKIRPAGPGWELVRDDVRAAAAATAPRAGRSGADSSAVSKRISEDDLVDDPGAPASRNLPLRIACLFIGSFMVYGALFATGYFIYGNLVAGAVAMVVSVGCAAFLASMWRKI